MARMLIGPTLTILSLAVLPAWTQDVLTHDAGGGPPREVPAPSNDTVPPGMTTDLLAECVAGKIHLTWTGTGDDDMTGTPSFYYVLLSPDPVFDNNIQWVYIDPPRPSGTLMSVDIGSGDLEFLLEARMTFYILLLTYDDALPNSNESPWHAPVVVTTPDSFDVVPPDAVETLFVDPITTTSLTLSWAPAADAGGSRLKEYEVRWRTESQGAVTPGNWDDASTFKAVVQAQAVLPGGEEGPLPPVSMDTLMIGGLQPGTGYHLAVRAGDNAGNPGAMPAANTFARTASSSGSSSDSDEGTSDGGGCSGSAGEASGAISLLLLIAAAARLRSGYGR